MNYYDLSNPSTPTTRGYRLGLWRLRRQRIYRILVVLAAILTYILLYLTLKRDDYTSEMLKSICLLFFSVAVFLLLLLVARNRIDVVRMRKREVQERHDYNYAMYRTLYKKNEKLRSITLIQMARQQIELHRPQMALQALELVKREKLNVAQLRSFYFYQAAAAYLDAQESWKEALSSCYAIPQKPQQLSQEEIESLFLPESNPDKLVLAESFLAGGYDAGCDSDFVYRGLLQCQWVTVMAVPLQKLGCVCLLFRPFLWVDSAYAVLAGQTVPADRKTDGKRKGRKDCAEDPSGASLDLSLFGK